MFVSKKKLSVQVAEINSVEVNDVDFAESGKNEVLEKFTSNTASSHHQYPRLELVVSTSAQSRKYIDPAAFPQFPRGIPEFWNK